MVMWQRFCDFKGTWALIKELHGQRLPTWPLTLHASLVPCALQLLAYSWAYHEHAPSSFRIGYFLRIFFSSKKFILWLNGDITEENHNKVVWQVSSTEALEKYHSPFAHFIGLSILQDIGRDNTWQTYHILAHLFLLQLHNDGTQYIGWSNALFGIIFPNKRGWKWYASLLGALMATLSICSTKTHSCGIPLANIVTTTSSNFW